jgi:hypothetical protein
MKKCITFDRIMLVLIFLVLLFFFYTMLWNLSQIYDRFDSYEINRNLNRIKQHQTFRYYVRDLKRDKEVGEFISSKTIQKGQIIFLDDDVYKVEIVKCFLKKNKDEENVYSEESHYLEVEFLGKSEKNKVN